MKYKAFFENESPEQELLRLVIAMHQLLLDNEEPKEVVEDEDVFLPEIPTDLKAIALTKEFWGTLEGREFYGEDLSMVKKWFEYRLRIARKDETLVKAIMCRTFLYGIDTAEWDEDERVLLYDSMADAQQCLQDFIKDENDAFEAGDISDPYQDDFEIRLVLIEDEKLIDAVSGQEYEWMQA